MRYITYHNNSYLDIVGFCEDMVQSIQSHRSFNIFQHLGFGCRDLDPDHEINTKIHELS